MLWERKLGKYGCGGEQMKQNAKEDHGMDVETQAQVQNASNT
jgi:hypothetical protein